MRASCWRRRCGKGRARPDRQLVKLTIDCITTGYDIRSDERLCLSSSQQKPERLRARPSCPCLFRPVSSCSADSCLRLRAVQPQRTAITAHVWANTPCHGALHRCCRGVRSVDIAHSSAILSHRAIGHYGIIRSNIGDQLAGSCAHKPSGGQADWHNSAAARCNVDVNK